MAGYSPWSEDSIYRAGLRAVLASGRSSEETVKVMAGKHAVLSAEALLNRWRNLPKVDADAFRADLDETLDPSL